MLVTLKKFEEKIFIHDFSLIKMDGCKESVEWSKTRGGGGMLQPISLLSNGVEANQRS